MSSLNNGTLSTFSVKCLNCREVVPFIRETGRGDLADQHRKMYSCSTCTAAVLVDDAGEQN